MVTNLARILPLLMVLLIGLQDAAAYQDQTNAEEVAEAVGDAVRNGDARRLSNLASGQIELDLGHGPETYSSDQARYVFTSFFEDHPPSYFELADINVGKDMCTARGRFLTIESNQPWDVFIRLSSSGKAWRLKELRISQSFPVRIPTPSSITPQIPHR